MTDAEKERNRKVGDAVFFGLMAAFLALPIVIALAR
jgi:hypothetical protein